MINNLTKNIQKIKEKIKFYKTDIILALIIILTNLIAFGLGRLSAISEKKTPLKIENFSSNVLNTSPKFDVFSQNKKFIASKKGKKYYFPWCQNAQRIKEKNKIWFSSRIEAEKAGYQPARNCKGL